MKFVFSFAVERLPATLLVPLDLRKVSYRFLWILTHRKNDEEGWKTVLPIS